MATVVIIYIFKIENKKEDYARAFQFVINGLCDDLEWLENHIIKLSTNSPITISSPGKLYKDTVKLVERELFTQTGPLNLEKIKTDSEETFNDNCYFYFRVIQKPEDDISNLHYYLLGREKIKEDELSCNNNCFMSISILEENDRYRISSFLVGEHFRKESIIPSVKFESNNKENQPPYRLRLIPNNEWIEDVFILTNTQHNSVLRVDSLNRVDLKPAHTFFTPIFLNKKNFFCLSQNVDFIFDSIRPKRPKNHLIDSDLIYALVAASIKDIGSLTEENIIFKINNNEQFVLNGQNFLAVSLREYCSVCYNEIAEEAKLNLPEKSKEFISHLKEFIDINASRFSVLSFCIFLSYVSYMISPPKKSNRNLDFDIDAIAMDAEDYADGLLQIIENAVAYAGGGYFCFRIHKVEKNDSTMVQRLNKYNLELDKGYYLEFMVSDCNLNDDILSKFYKNVENYREEYDVNNTDLQEMKDSFTLGHFFNYKLDKKKLWLKFYSKPKNIISHYGLLVFENLVRFAQGGFSVFSSNHFVLDEHNYFSNKENVINNKWHLPGTQYEILLPLTYIKKQYDTGLNAKLDSKALKLKFNQINIPFNLFATLNDDDIYDKIKADNDNTDNVKKYLYWKHALIEEFTNNTLEFLNKEFIDNKVIINFDVNYINNPLAAEVFSKSFISILHLNEILEVRYFAIQNASDTLLTTFNRIFSLLYMKTGNNSIMKRRQVYICSPNAEKEYMFFEESIKKSISASMSLATVKGVYNRELLILNRTAEKCDERKPRIAPSILPFDVLLNGLFVKKIKTDLERCIQEKPFGCCLKNVHMRVGTKIHIYGNYYEASLLFSFSNYVSRFAFILSNKMIPKVKKDVRNCRKYVLVGYEVYSESLMINLKQMLNAYYKKDLFYYTIYYEGNRREPFSDWESIQTTTDILFFIVVPIGSTLTTHDKVIADLARCMHKNVNELESNLVIGNYAVTVIRNSGKENLETGLRGIESEFWDKVVMNSDGGTVGFALESKKTREIEVVSFVDSCWELPNKCPYCFPERTLIQEEEPLTQSNRASVVPMTMYGLVEKNSSKTKNDIIDSENYERLQFLKDGLCYGHIVRDNDNHFEYYFQTDKVMRLITQYENKRDKTNREDYKSLKNWLYNVRTKLIAPKGMLNIGVYHFLVAPLHKTNAEFVHAVNETVFGNAQQIIWLDIKREYRDNVIAKYSNLTTLYKNLKNAEKSAEIHFHFVDDTITSGFTINRSKSILQSLFCDTTSQLMNPLSKSKIKIHLFSSIILLLNRCSDYTMSNYVEYGNHMSFIQLNISSMRSHSDACVPCKNYNDYFVNFRRAAASNELSSLFFIKARKYESRKSESTNSKIDIFPLHIQDKNLNEIDINTYKNRYFLRMMATHRFNTIFGKLGGDKNNKTKIKESIWTEISNICEGEDFNTAYNQLFSALKVLSRPFLSFRHSILKATTAVLLEITSYFFFEFVEPIPPELNKINVFFNNIKNGDKKLHQEFLMLLFSCLSKVNSTFPLRSFVIVAFFKYCNNYEFDIPDLIPRYAMYAKRLLTISGRENISVWFEELLHNSYEPFPNTEEHIDKKIFGIKKFINLLQLENTAPICVALNECYKVWERSGSDESSVHTHVNDTLSQYYCKTYRDYQKVSNQIDSSTFLAMIKLYIHLIQPKAHSGNMTTKNDYYGNFIRYTKEILGSETVILFIKPKEESIIYRLYPKDSKLQNKDADICLINSSLERFATNVCNEIYESVTGIGNTLYWKNESGVCLRLIKFVNNKNIKEEKQTQLWYLAYGYRSDGNHEPENDIILKARNLLSMRYAIMERLTYDFNNNVLTEFLKLKKQVVILSNDKSASHTPFDEICNKYSYICKRAESLSENETEKKALSYSLELIVDALISKLYVLGVFDMLPEQLICSKDGVIKYAMSTPFEKINTLLPLFDCFNVKKGIHEIYLKTRIDESIYNQDVYVADFGTSLWQMIIISLIINSLNHGYREEDKDRYIVNCNVTLKTNEYGKPVAIRVSNKYLQKEDNNNNEQGGITLKAIIKFFELLPGIAKLKVDKEQEVGTTIDGKKLKYFCVDIPIIENKS